MIVPQQSNRLAKEKSPYLQQHAGNPVDWFPWGDEAFEKARREEKPIFLSVGYSTCHWCHVMERESFENTDVAGFLNEHFVSVKVDREERPDIDRLYMLFVQATTGSGGWPMCVFLTPELRPFAGGTYFPPDGRFGRPGFLALLRSIARLWHDDRARIETSAQRVIAALGGPTEPTEPADWLETAGRCFNQLLRSFDAGRGGFGSAPKFPRPTVLQFLFRHAYRKGTSRAAHMAAATLDAMAAGGLHDQVGGGFHRYSVDGNWHVPHFEKMLYDQAQLVVACVDAFQLTGESRHAEIARRTLSYVARDLGAPGGAFFSAEDADSKVPDGAHVAEGAYYVWSAAEIDALFGETRSPFVRRCFGVEPGGNAPGDGDPHGEFDGLNILTRRIPLNVLANNEGIPLGDAVKHCEEAVRELAAVRASRPRPLRDEKIITSWNGLMISAFARAGATFGDLEMISLAEAAARFFQQHGAIRRCFRDGPSDAPATADDYAFLIQGLLDLYEAGSHGGWLKWASALQEMQNELFWDPDGGYFGSAAGDPSILIRMKEGHDSAEPAAGSVAAYNLIRLSALCRRPEWMETARRVAVSFSRVLSDHPSALPYGLMAFDLLDRPVRQIVVAGRPDAPGRWDLVRELHRSYHPDRVVLFADGGADARWLVERAPELATMKVGENGEALAYVCSDFLCKEPTADPAVLRELLSERPAIPTRG